jgi:hypothetical protein
VEDSWVGAPPAPLLGCGERIMESDKQFERHEIGVGLRRNCLVDGAVETVLPAGHPQLLGVATEGVFPLMYLQAAVMYMNIDNWEGQTVATPRAVLLFRPPTHIPSPEQSNTRA